MPRRAAASATPIPTSSRVSFRDTSLLSLSDPTYTENISTLRRHWKWAAFSQFFYTFAQLFSMPDVTLTDIEDDLARSTTLFLPRIIVRLLYTLTQDRKINVDNWQVALRKQYLKRDPAANPLGVEQLQPSAKQSREPTVSFDQDEGPIRKDTDGHADATLDVTMDEEDRKQEPAPDLSSQQVIVEAIKEEDSPDGVKVEEDGTQKEEADGMQVDEPEEEVKDWLELPMLTKLDSLHLLTEWQFQNPHRLRQIMKDDDEGANWRIEPIGYDAKTNAYWLIGLDRLWIQRVPPKPPKPPKRKRASPKKAAARASSSRAVVEESESEEEAQPAKRTRPSRSSSKRFTRQQQAAEPPETPSERSARAAKLQANKKLGAQAKELAEFQRQANLLKKVEKSPVRPTRQTRGRTEATPNRPLGTRVSARLRGPTKDDDEWQQIPDEWLKSGDEDESDAEEAHPRNRRGVRYMRSAAKGKGKEKVTEGAGQVHLSDGEDDAIAARAGLMSGDDSELTELSDDEKDKEKVQEQEPLVAPEKSRSTPTPSPPSPPECVESSPSKVEEPEEEPVHEQPALEPEPEEDNTHIPADFVEWEAICVTLEEWDHIAERFEKATHYLEKALFRVLTQHIVPAVTAELREVERKRKMEEAIVHRKRSSRIAMKETEKEEARVAAKRKAEEDEKMARQRRMEARAKKEEAERQKREQAREQRRLEREERERRARERQEREKSPGPASTTNGASSSAQVSRVATPSGSRTPDWVLDCEICHKSGINVDDGLPMVSCGRCSKWQHITCHDLADRKEGRPPRNWQQGQFYCQHCKYSRSNGLSNGSSSVQQALWQQQHPKQQPAVYDTYPQPTSDMHYPQQQPYQGLTYAQQQYAQGSLGPDSYPRHQRGGITFAHYQPNQRGFTTTTRSSHTVPPAQPSWPSGRLPGDGLDPRSHSPAQYINQAAQYPNNDMYMANRIPTPYQRDPGTLHTYSIVSTQSQGMPLPDGSIPNGNWPTTANGYHQSNAGHAGHLSAAESLAHLQNGGMSRQGWSPGPSSYAQPNAALINLQMIQQQRMSNTPSYQFPQS